MLWTVLILVLAFLVSFVAAYMILVVSGFGMLLWSIFGERHALWTGVIYLGLCLLLAGLATRWLAIRFDLWPP